VKTPTMNEFLSLLYISKNHVKQELIEAYNVSISLANLSSFEYETHTENRDMKKEELDKKDNIAICSK
jgi:hypothetical protein